ncbi:MAG: sensor histidine kinase [Myxococcales bacterium]
MKRPRLVLRIYLIGLAQVAALGIALAIVHDIDRERRRAPPDLKLAQYVVEDVIGGARDPAELQARLQGLKEQIGLAVTIRDREARILASTGAEQRGRGPGHFEFDSSMGHVTAALPPPGPPPSRSRALVPLVLILGLVGISAVLTAAWLARPLSILSDAARALGAGKLASRANLRRNDELGDVAVAFNEMAERVGELIRAQRELLANVSHELRTPLARIRVALDLAAEGDAQQAATSLREIADDLAELERLIGDILTTAKFELASDTASPAQPPLRLARFATAELVEDAAGRFRASHAGRTLDVVDDAPGAMIVADRMLLRRAIDNLLDNAAKHSGATDSIILFAKASDGHVVLEVRDRGAGISAEDQKRLFTPFFRADKSRARQTGGLGLGLLLSRRIVEAHGGTLALTSAPQAGTTVRIRLPAAAAAGDETSAISAS